MIQFKVHFTDIQSRKKVWKGLKKALVYLYYETNYVHYSLSVNNFQKYICFKNGKMLHCHYFIPHSSVRPSVHSFVQYIFCFSILALLNRRLLGRFSTAVSSARLSRTFCYKLGKAETLQKCSLYKPLHFYVFFGADHLMYLPVVTDYQWENEH